MHPHVLIIYFIYHLQSTKFINVDYDCLDSGSIWVSTCSFGWKKMTKSSSAFHKQHEHCQIS